jgi:predicted nucleic acid-binding protein
VQAARLDNLCRTAGVQCGEVDMLLCAVAERNNWTILTNDAGLIRCAEVVQHHATEGKPEPGDRRLLEVV